MRMVHRERGEPPCCDSLLRPPLLDWIRQKHPSVARRSYDIRERSMIRNHPASSCEQAHRLRRRYGPTVRLHGIERIARDLQASRHQDGTNVMCGGSGRKCASPQLHSS
jgi:hypothetical protein